MGAWGKVRFHPIRPSIRRPVAAKQFWFYGATSARFGGRPRPLIHSTGACTLLSDVVQVQFVNAAWKEKQKTLPPEVCARPFARGRKGPSAWLRNGYHDLLLDLNVGIERKVYSREKTYIAIARSVAEELGEHFGIRERVHVIHHGVDSAQFAPASREPELRARQELRERLGARPEELIIAFVGAYERKGLAVAIEALSRLSPEARARGRLMAVGGGAEEGFRALARSRGVEDRVVFAGHSRDVPAYYRAADLFLLPTLYEPFGLVILEAMAAGLAPVVSRLAGGSELIEDGVSGSLIDDPTDPSEIAGRIEKLLMSPEHRVSMAGEARRVAERRSWDRVADEYAAVIEPLLRTPG